MSIFQPVELNSKMNNQIEKYALDQFGNLKPRSEVFAQEKHKAMLDGGLNSNKQGQESQVEGKPSPKGHMPRKNAYWRAMQD